jgi:hypothetical protein
MRTRKKDITKRKLIACICAAFYLSAVSTDLLSSPLDSKAGDQLHTKVIIRLTPASAGQDDENDGFRARISAFLQDFSIFSTDRVRSKFTAFAPVDMVRQALQTDITINGP